MKQLFKLIHEIGAPQVVKKRSTNHFKAEHLVIRKGKCKALRIVKRVEASKQMLEFGVTAVLVLEADIIERHGE